MSYETDRRVKRSRRLLRQALLTLMQEKGFEALTVGDLTDHADLNRATFYKHYIDKVDLLESTIEDKLDELIEQVSPRDDKELFIEVEGPSPVTVRLFEFVLENRDFFLVMMGEKGIPSFQKRLLQVVVTLIAADKETLHSTEIPKETFIHYVASAHLGVLTNWLETGMQTPPFKMAEHLHLLTIKGPLNAIHLDTNQ